MKIYYWCDAHKKYSLFTSLDKEGYQRYFIKGQNDCNQFSSFLRTLLHRSLVALESIGNWYWIIDEMEKASHVQVLEHARKAKLMMEQINKTDKLDVWGLTEYFEGMNHIRSQRGIWFRRPAVNSISAWGLRSSLNWLHSFKGRCSCHRKGEHIHPMKPYMSPWDEIMSSINKVRMERISYWHRQRFHTCIEDLLVLSWWMSFFSFLSCLV